jgi:putative transcriptional regulator
MSRIKEIRERLDMTQSEFAEALGCTQGNIGHYERGQTMPPERAQTLIEFAARKSLRLTLDQVYGRSALPVERKAKA